ncbi:MAG TPA: GNAT family N-acetyltransferase [Dehalococcoidales bacterium]|nr:GNAT family N-acetyltransferase [Dehalococcoidales bacterium]
MEPDIRPILPSELDDFLVVVRLGFGLPPEFKVNLKPEWTLCAFSNGKLATSYAAWPLEMYFDGTAIPVGGVTWVATHPLFRRRNFLRKITEAHFKALKASGGPSIVALQASMASIYQRYGYAVVSTRNTYSVEPQYIKFTRELPVSGQLREAADSDVPSMVDIYNRFARNKTGLLKRGPGMENAPGNMTVLKVMPPATPIKLIYSESGKELGYVIYSTVRDISGGNPLGQRIMISDMAYLTPGAYQAIWGYFANMDIIIRLDWGKVPPDDPLPHLLMEPRKLNLTSADGLLGRIVDVEKALPQRRYPVEGELSFTLIDDLCDWNQGAWKFTASHSSNSLKRTRGKTQITLPVSTLAMLFFGQINASQAAAMGRLEANEPSALETWDRVMRTTFRPACTDIF